MASFEYKATPWVSLGTKIQLGRFRLAKSTRKIFLDVGTSKDNRGRFCGIGHTQGSTKGHKQWFRMDYHSPHGNHNATWGNYHAHYTN